MTSSRTILFNILGFPVSETKLFFIVCFIIEYFTDICSKFLEESIDLDFLTNSFFFFLN